jgi:hypothetical protein
MHSARRGEGRRTGEVLVMGVYVTSPVMALVSTPPNVSVPFVVASVVPVVGSYEMPMDSVGIVPWLYRLSVTVGTVLYTHQHPRSRT